MDDWLVINHMKKAVYVVRRPNGLHTFMCLREWQLKGYKVYFSYKTL